jgi:hypothetical protein
MSLPSYLPQQSNIKAYYALEDVNDGSGNGYNLTNGGSVTFTPAKYANGANLGAGNTTKSLYAATNLGITVNNPFTIMFWFKLFTEPALNAYQALFHFRIGTAAASKEIVLYYRDDAGTKKLSLNIYTNAWHYATYNITLGTTDWYQIGAMYNGSNQIVLLVNTETTTNGTIAAGSETIAQNFHIGKNNAGTYFTSGLYDEFTVWNMGLGTADISQFYRGPRRGGFGFGNPWTFFKDAWEKHDKLWKPKLILPKDLGFSY